MYILYVGVFVFTVSFYKGWDIDISYDFVLRFVVSFYKGWDIDLIVLFLCLLCHFTNVGI